MHSVERALLIAVLAISATTARANDWVYGNVSIVEDYGNYGSGAGEYQVLITLSSKYWTVPADASVCTERFRVVVGVEGVTEDFKKRIFAMMVAARLSGERVRLFYNKNTGPYCAVQIASMGDVGN